MCRPVCLSWTADATSAGTPSMFPTPLLASVKAEGKFILLVYELFLGLSRGEETFQIYGDKELGGRVGSRRLGYSRNPTLSRGSPQHVEYLFQGKATIATCDID